MIYKNKFVYHLVPGYIYNKSVSKSGDYNCSGFENSNFIHTTTNLKQLKNIAATLFAEAGKFPEPPSTEFLLLIIDMKKVKTKIKFVNTNYCHIYGSISKNAYKVKKVKRNQKGRFIIIQQQKHKE